MINIVPLIIIPTVPISHCETDIGCDNPDCETCNPMTCPYDICDGSGIYEEQIAVDDVREKKCLCKTDSDMDDDS